MGGLVLLTGVPKETRQEKIENTIGDLATIALSVAGGPEGMLMSQGGKAPALKVVEDIKKTAKMAVVKKGTSEWQNAIQAIRTKKKSDILVNTTSDAKDLLLGAQGNLNRYKNYTTKQYKKGYEVHNVQNKGSLMLEMINSI
ncbi:hypothetical protein ACN9MN_14980 [Chryseobacterium sp. S-02]|uniref:hypothetical protein n=1 Tax=Chryseobacterium sp. S-02 TaxID=3404064 RepID=UPI003CF93F8F